MSATITVVGIQWGDEGTGWPEPTCWPRRCRSWCLPRPQAPVTPSWSTAKPSPCSCLPSGILYDHITPVIANAVVVDPAVPARRDPGRSPARESTVPGCSCRATPADHAVPPAVGRALPSVTMVATSSRTTRRGHRADCRRQTDSGRASGSGPARPEDLPPEARRGPQGEEPHPGQGVQPVGPVSRRHRQPLSRRVRPRSWLPSSPTPSKVVHEALSSGQHVLLEGAREPRSSTIWTTAPIPSSIIQPGGRRGLRGRRHRPSQDITSVIGIAKAYVTRVGSGAVCTTELHDEIGDLLVERGYEFRDQHRPAPADQVVRHGRPIRQAVPAEAFADHRSP